MKDDFFPKGIKRTPCAFRSHTVILHTRHGIVRTVASVSNWATPLAVTKKMGGYS